ncbi:MAG TPA: pyridoxamine 5'-phosphate oxidase family protein [Bacteroidales bacterium]|nr:pyridoxamine 5'-phosphate oxidase family protein [Bacteroidales bacterium]
MFREVRRKNRELPSEFTAKILSEGEYGVLGTICEDGFPYVTPLSYVYHEDKIYFHCAQEGLKTDNIRLNSKVSFTVVTDVEALPEHFSTKYQSVVLFGLASFITGKEKDDVLFEIIKKYAGAFPEEGRIYIEKLKDRTDIVGIEILHQSAKGRLK